MELSVVLIAHDEAHRIARCLETLRFADEIVVVVSEQTRDDTAEVARRYTDRVFVRRFTGFSDQRRWADEQARGAWILSVDCDEMIPEALAREIRQTIGRAAVDAYAVPRLDYMFGRWIRHGGWYYQYLVRLYRRGAARWERTVHERAEAVGAVERLKHPLLHFSHDRVESWVNKMARYTTLEARAMFDSGARVGIRHLVLEPPAYAAYKLVWQQGWRDGMHGLALALLLGAYRLVCNLKIWDLQQSAGGPREPEDRPPWMSRS